MPKFPPLFRRRDSDQQPRLPTHVNRSPRRPSSQTTRAVTEPLSMKRRPTFLQWLKLSFLDICTLLILGAITYGVFIQPPAATRTFPVTYSQSFTRNQPSLAARASAGSGDVVWPQFAYPYRVQIIPSYADTLLAVGVPILFILIAQIRVWSFWDVNNGVFGVVHSVLSGTVFQVFVKFLVGGLRPHFYDVCKPDVSLASLPGGNKTGLEGTGFGGLFYTRAICSDQNAEGISNALESFPSGHTTAAFAGFVFLSLYLNAKLKVFSNHQPAMWKVLVMWLPLLGGTLIGGSLTVDQTHNWYDILAGGIIGTMMAFFSYRMMYASVWDWRTNHIPLHRHQPFVFAEGGPGANWVFTRQAGWGASKRSVRKKVRALVGHDREKEKELPVAEARTRYSMSPGRNGHVSGAGGSDLTPAFSSPRRAAAPSSDNSRYGRGRVGDDMV